MTKINPKAEEIHPEDLQAAADYYDEYVLNKVTDERKLEYLKSPFHCPFCQSTSISANEMDDDGGHNKWQEVECVKCGATWTDVYTLTGIMDTKRGNV